MQLEFRVLVFRGVRKTGKTSRGKILEVRINLGEASIGRPLSLCIPVMFNLRCLMKLNARYSPK